MIKVEVTKDFRLADFKKLKNVVRVTSKDEEGMLYVGDTFECDEEMAKYLTGENKLKRAFVKVVEVIEFFEEKIIPVAYNEPVGEKGEAGEPNIKEKSKKKKNSKKKKGE